MLPAAIRPFAESQRCRVPFESAALLPVMERPLFTVAPGQVRRMSRSLLPMPLPSLVHSGRMVLPEKS